VATGEQEDYITRNFMVFDIHSALLGPLSQAGSGGLNM